MNRIDRMGYLPNSNLGVKGVPKVQHRADEKCGMWLRFSVFTALGQFISFDGHLSIPMALL